MPDHPPDHLSDEAGSGHPPEPPREAEPAPEGASGDRRRTPAADEVTMRHADRAWAFGITIICMLVVVAVMFSERRNEPVGMAVATALLTLVVATTIYGLLPVPRAVRVPVSIGTAAAFYILLLPQLKEMIFEQPVHGTVAYVGEVAGVPGVAVRVPNTGVSAFTGPNGEFSLPNVPSGRDSIQISHEGFDTLVALAPRNQRRRYAVLPRFSTATTPSAQIPATEWRLLGSGCPEPPEGPPSQLFELDTTLIAPPAPAGATGTALSQELSLQLAPGGLGRVVVVDSRGLSVGRRVADDTRILWRFSPLHDPEGSRYDLRVLACVQEPSGAPAVPPRSLYWIEYSMRT